MNEIFPAASLHTNPLLDLDSKFSLEKNILNKIYRVKFRAADQREREKTNADGTKRKAQGELIHIDLPLRTTPGSTNEGMFRLFHRIIDSTDVKPLFAIISAKDINNSAPTDDLASYKNYVYTSASGEYYFHDDTQYKLKGELDNLSG